MNFVLKTAPAVEPVDLATAKAHLRITQTDQDSVIIGQITAARELVEQITGRPLVTQTWVAKGPGFDSKIDLLPGLKSVTHIKYLDAEKNQQTLNSDIYDVIDSGLLGAVFLAYGSSWPETYQHEQAVEIEFVCGYGDASVVPKPIIQAILLLVGHYYENRENTSTLTIKEVPFAVESLLSPYQIPVIR